MKLSSLSDENSTHQNEAQSQTIIKYNNNKQRQEYRETKITERAGRKEKKETHLTISGVCTTVRPEKSGT
jgi:hypothetical protein